MLAVYTPFFHGLFFKASSRMFCPFSNIPSDCLFLAAKTATEAMATQDKLQRFFFFFNNQKFLGEIKSL